VFWEAQKPIFRQQTAPKGGLSARKGAKSEAFGAYTMFQEKKERCQPHH